MATDHSFPPVSKTGSSTASPVFATALTAASLLFSASAMAAPPFPLGTYAGNPDGNSAANEQQFEKQFDGFVAAMGKPGFMNAFVDFTQDPSQWPSNASWTAWSWAMSPVVGHSVTPVIGVPMASNAGGWGNAGLFFQAISAGTYDADYKGVVDAWVGQGYKTMYMRLGYEMNGTFMAWYAGSDPTTNGEWVAAFQHLSTILRAEAQKDGASLSIVWNPNEENWTSMSVANLYPGDSYVDVIAVDAYNVLYPLDLTDWKNGGEDLNVTSWMGVPANRRHFWMYPSANQWNTKGQVSGSPSLEYTGWSLQDTIALARRHGKPIAIAESGAGLSINNGAAASISDDGAFPNWLASELTSAEAQGVKVAFVDVWDACMSDGCWDFTSSAVRKPNEKSAWQKGFGGATP